MSHHIHHYDHLDLHEGDRLGPEPASSVCLLLHRPLVHVRAALKVPAANAPLAKLVLRCFSIWVGYKLYKKTLVSSIKMLKNTKSN